MHTTVCLDLYVMLRNNTNNNSIIIKTYKREGLLDVHLSSIRPSTQLGLTTITTWLNDNNK